MSQNNIVTKSDLEEFYSKILPYLGSGLKLAGPVGMIISYMGNTAPSGYLACDGSWYDIGDYPKLANWMMDEFNSYSYFALSGETVQSGKFKVPDLRGEFLRGTGTNSHANQGSGANVGEHQDGTEIPYAMTSGANIVMMEQNTYPGKLDKTISSGTKQRYLATQEYTGGSTTRLYTSRPTNTSVLYCIKYEEYEGDGVGEVYSTDERVVGKWIDGTPLYQKTVSCGALPNATSKTVAHGISNLSKIVDQKGYAYRPSNANFLVLPHVSATTSPVSIACTSTNINIVTADDRSAYTESYITLQYTKA